MSLIKLANEVDGIIEEENQSRDPLNYKRTGIAAGGIGAMNAGLGNYAYKQWKKNDDILKNFLGDLDPDALNFLNDGPAKNKNKVTRGKMIAKGGLAGAAMGAAGDQIIQRRKRRKKENEGGSE